ncbi:MAG TPA: c-type cytochrome [Bryobacteraceae bacterium]|jgi:mono/diheme cytochrome c family protein|nr:c-type cytochrome [Bryobacteraceae bacterium]
MRNVFWFVAGAVALAVVCFVAAIIFLKTARGFSAHAQPSGVEKWVARQARGMAVPSGAKQRKNPVPNSPAVLTEAKAHWADHCATCHANDGSGQTEIGGNMYPPAPDMRKRDTQEMTDGELFYIIQNGIRLSGMPAWSSGSEHDEEDSWKLVRFIRHLPNLSQSEIKEMQKLNPKTPEEQQEEQEEEEFLKGASPSDTQTHENQHHH